MNVSSIIPIPLLLRTITPRAKIEAIFCRANLPACCPPAPEGYRVRGVENGLVYLENLATHEATSCERTEIHSVRVFVTWEV